MDGNHLILGLREESRPVGEGYLYYKFSPRENERILLFLNLYETSEDEIEDIFKRALLKIAIRERVENVTPLLSGYSTENMRPWVQDVLARVVNSFIPYDHAG